MADTTDGIIPEGITKESSEDTQSTTLTDLLNFFQDSNKNINEKDENSLIKSGGIIGKSSVYLVNEFKKIFEGGRSSSSNESTNKLKGMDFKTLAGLSAGIVALTTAGAHVYNFFKDKRIVKALADAQVNYYIAMAEAYKTPVFKNALAYILAGKELSNIALLFTSKTAMIMGGVAAGLSAVAESCAKIYNYFADPRVIKAIADSQVAYFEAAALAYKTDRFIDNMAWILSGTSGMQEMLSSVLTGLGEGAQKAYQMFTDDRVKDAISKSQVVYFEALGEVYKTDTFKDKLAEKLPDAAKLQATIDAAISGVAQGITDSLNYFFDDSVKTAAKNSTIAYIEAVSEVYKSETFKNEMVQPLRNAASVQEKISGVITGVMDGFKRGWDAITSDEVKTSNINALTAYNDALINLYKSDEYFNKLLDIMAEPNTATQIGEGIASVMGGIGAGTHEYIKGLFTGKEKSKAEESADAYFNAFIEVYESPNFKNKLQYNLEKVDYSKPIGDLLGNLNNEGFAGKERERLMTNLVNKLDAYIRETTSEDLFSNGNFRLNLQYVKDVKNANTSQINYSNLLNTIINKLEIIKQSTRGLVNTVSLSDSNNIPSSPSPSFDYNSPTDYGDNINYSYY